MISLLGDDLSSSDTGALTENGLAALSLYVSQMNVSREAAESFHKEINSMQEALDKGTLSFIDSNGIQRDYASVFELQKAVKEFYSSYQDEIKNTYDYESKTADLMKQKYQSELDYLKDLIDKKTEALNAEKDLYEYSRNIKKQTDNINSLRKQLAALNGDTSAETNARIQKLQAQLKDAEEELKDTEYDRYISDQQDMLQNLYDEYAQLTEKITKDRDRLLKEGLDLFAQTGSDTQDAIRNAAEEHGYEMTGEMEKIITSIEGMGSMETYLGVNGNITKCLSDIVKEVHDAYTSLTPEFQKLQDAVQSIGFKGSYNTADTDESNKNGSDNSGNNTNSGNDENNADADNNGNNRNADNSPADTDVTVSIGNPDAADNKALTDINEAAVSSGSLSSEIGDAVNSLPAGSVISAAAKKALIENLLKNGTNTDYDPKKASSLNKYIYGKYGSALTEDEMSVLSKYLGLDYSADDLAAENKNHSKYKKNILHMLQLQGFSKGGIVRDLEDAVRLNDDSVLVSAKPGEGFLDEKNTKLLQVFTENLDKLRMNTAMAVSAPWDKAASVPGYTVQGRNTGTHYQFGNMTFNIAEASDLDELMRGLQKSHEFERMFGAMVETKLTGRNRLGKNSVTFGR